MTIIAKSRDLTPVESYTMTRGTDVIRMRDAVGVILEIDCWLLREEEDGEKVSRILTIKAKDGKMYSTNSAIFQREFSAISECFGEQLPSVKVISQRSKAGRDYMTCTIV